MDQYIILALLIFIAFFSVYTYNRLVGLRNLARNSLANIDALLQKRFDLVPNLVNTVKGYMKHEQEVLEKVTQARNAWLKATTLRDNADADGKAAGALKTLFAISERYPELKANQNFLMLQEELAGLENKIAYARRHYNATVMVFNTLLERFPTNFLARLFRFAPLEYFRVEAEEARQAPEVNFGGDKSS